MKRTVSVIMIARDEEPRIGLVLKDIKPYVDEMVVVDTGSADRTREIAASLGAKVFNEPWEDDFAKAKNAALDRATGDYVLWLDADDRLPAEDAAAIRTTVYRAKPKEIFSVEVINPQQEGRPFSYTQVRLFPRAPELRFEGKIHESIAGAAKAHGFQFSHSEIKIIHTGYETAAARSEKMARNLKILERELAAHPERITHRFLLANTLLSLGRREEALLHYERIANTPGAKAVQADVFTRTLVQLAKISSESGDPLRGEAWAKKAVEERPEDMEAHAERSRALWMRGQTAEALEAARRALSLDPYLSSVGIDFIGVRAFAYQLAIQLSNTLGKFEEAAALVEEGVKELPYSAEMVSTAADYYLKLGKTTEAESALRRAAMRMPQFADHFNARLKSLSTSKKTPKEGLQTHPDYLKQVPAGTGKVLVAGAGSGQLGLELKKQGVLQVYALLLPGDDREQAAGAYDGVAANTETLKSWGATFDFALFGDRIGKLADPDSVIRAVEGALKPGGKALFALPNVRHYTILSTVACGLSPYGGAGPVKEEARRLFTRREFLLYLDRLGFKPETITESRDPLYAQVAENRSLTLLNLGRAQLDLSGLSAEAVREYFILQYFITCAKKTGEPLVEALRQRVEQRSAQVLNGEGLALLLEKKYGEAASRFHEALNVEKENAESYCNLGLCEWYQGRAEDAYYLFKKSASLSPAYEDALLNLWEAAQKTGRETEARAILTEAVRLHPHLYDIRQALGLA